MAIEITKPRVIICEGKADAAFFEHLIPARGLPEFQMLPANGRSGYEQSLVALTAAPGFSNLSGVLVVGDSDLDPAAAFRNIQTQIQRAGGYGVPPQPCARAKTADFPAVVVMMVPWHGERGCLETLLLEAVRGAHADLGQCVDTYAICAQVQTWNATELPKMKLQSLIAVICRSDPTTPVSYAWSRNEDIISLAQPCFDQIAGFLQGFPDLVA